MNKKYVYFGTILAVVLLFFVMRNSAVVLDEVEPENTTQDSIRVDSLNLVTPDSLPAISVDSLEE